MKAAETTEYNNAVNKKEFKQSWIREKREPRKSKRLNEQFVREMPETIDKKETWNWPRKAHLKVEAEVMLCAAQNRQFEQTMRNTLCRMCDKKSETISHIVSECEKLARKEYTIMLHE